MTQPCDTPNSTLKRSPKKPVIHFSNLRNPVDIFSIFSGEACEIFETYPNQKETSSISQKKYLDKLATVFLPYDMPGIFFQMHHSTWIFPN